MISKTQTLSSFVQVYKDSDLDLGVFATQDEKRYALRAIMPSNPGKGLFFVASFAKSVEEANRPTTKEARSKATQRLNAILHGPEAAEYTVGTCVIDEDSIKQYPDKYTAEDLGKTFISVYKTKAVESDDLSLVAAEKKVATVDAD